MCTTYFMPHPAQEVQELHVFSTCIRSCVLVESQGQLFCTKRVRDPGMMNYRSVKLQRFFNFV